MTDYFEAAKALRVVDVWKPGNETGWVTPKILYDPTLRASDGQVKAPLYRTPQWWMDHGTVGTNTLRFWGEKGSVNNGSWTLAHLLVPKEATEYQDGHIHDTTNVVFKMVPPKFACNHTGDCISPISNINTRGVEYESLQNGTHDITNMQYIKGALLYTHDVAEFGIPDWRRVMHGLVAIPWGRRSDPWAGRFDIARSWTIVQAIREDKRIWDLWKLPQPTT